MAGAKSYEIAKREVWQAYKRVKANKGAAGVDGVTLGKFEQNLGRNLYRIWNRLSSGSYFAPPVRRGAVSRRCEIPNADVACRWPCQLDLLRRARPRSARAEGSVRIQ